VRVLGFPQERSFVLKWPGELGRQRRGTRAMTERFRLWIWRAT